MLALFATLPGQKFGVPTVETADDFAYHDPVDSSDTEAQGIRVMFYGGSCIVCRLAGAGTVGATLRACIERWRRSSRARDGRRRAW